MMFFQQKQQLNFMIQSIKEATAGQFVQQAPPQPQPQQQQQQQAQSEPVYNSDEDEDFSVVSESSNTGSGIKPDIIVSPKRRGRPKR
jgi:hypothetical protein